MKFFYYRKGFEENIETLDESMSARDALCEIVNRELSRKITPNQLIVKEHLEARDNYTGWEKTYAVYTPDGVVGYTNGPLVD